MEIWKPIRNFPSYNVSSEGRIINIKTQRIIKPHKDEKGYEKVCLRKSGRQYTVRVHKIIAETFLGEHSDLDVRHKNGNRSDNDISNLEWCTRKETISRAYEIGSKKPARHTPIRVIETGKEYFSIRECAKDINCWQTEICKCLSGKISNTKGYHFECV